MLILAACSAGSSGFSAGFVRSGVSVVVGDEPGKVVVEDEVNREAMSLDIGLNTIAALTNSDNSLSHSSGAIDAGYTISTHLIQPTLPRYP